MEEQLVLTTNIINADFYISSLAIGILEGMKSGTVTFEEGIWSLGRPIFWNCLVSNAVISATLLECIQSFDEIESVNILSSRNHAIQMIDELLCTLYNCQKQSLAMVSHSTQSKDNPDLCLYGSVREIPK